MDYREILYQLGDHVLTITLNRPDKLNAFTLRMCAELLHALDQADADDDVRAVVLTGAGRAFCAGADLSRGANTWAASHSAAGASFAFDAEQGDSGGQLTRRMFECRKPLIVAINGAAVGVGLTMTLAADMRLCVREAKLGFVFAARGIVPEACSAWFLPRIVGIAQALEWAYTARIFAPDEALRAGLVRSLHAPEELLPAAHALAREIADNAAPVSVALTRQMMWKMLCADHPVVAHRLDTEAIFARGASADAKEGIEAFLQKRPARFVDSVSEQLPRYDGFFPRKSFGK
ncbi:MAG: enoyl-CoA hydratase-related protein [Polyangiales bacterium]